MRTIKLILIVLTVLFAVAFALNCWALSLYDGLPSNDILPSAGNSDNMVADSVKHHTNVETQGNTEKNITNQKLLK